MPLQANIGTGNYDKNDEEVMATYWVVFDINVNWENGQASCSALGYIKKKHYTDKRKIVASRMFSWIGKANPLNAFDFAKNTGIISQMQTAIIAYNMIDPVTGQPAPGEFSTATVVDGS
jgi:hypothetical protein